jgi:cytochrome c553
VVVALSTARELGLAAVAGAFILFALVAAFVLPARDHNFPGPRLPLFVAVTVLLFVAMMTAVVVLAREPEEEGGHEAEPAATGTQAEPEPVEGDPEAGKSVFASAACGSCHTLEEAGSSGTIGPRLDDTPMSQDAIVRQVADGGGGMPAFRDQLSEEQIQDVAAFVLEAGRS